MPKVTRQKGCPSQVATGHDEATYVANDHELRLGSTAAFYRQVLESPEMALRLSNDLT